ncbi:MAG: ATP synthase F1 subunit gamma [Lachnospiraceae bacterium]|nr:ATP synthase F1 subunit gamma [Lachnospiraceae bacterium]
MSNAKEIKNRIGSVTDTQKITNAMYLIASTKLRKARTDMTNTSPYFETLKGEIERIFRSIDHIDSDFFLPEGLDDSRENFSKPGKYAILVITADKGLAGSYNQSVIKETLKLLERHQDCELFVVGEYGRNYFESHGYPISKSFLYTAQNPNMDRAREISNLLVETYLSRYFKKVYLVYTDFGNGLNPTAQLSRLLPLHRSHFETDVVDKGDDFEYFPSKKEVLENLIPNYITGYIYSALVDSYCSEQNARMMAMDRATQNAQDILDRLSLEYNHVRQGAITQEIIEVSAGAKSLKLAKAKNRN